MYGDDVAIHKEECVKHVAKQIGTALRNLTKMSKKTGVSLGGRGPGKLIKAAIKKLQVYYRKAICSCTGDEVAMCRAVFSSFFHAVSTDEDPHHHHCPAAAAGTNSWCFYQRAVANGEEPGSHRENVHSTGS